MKYFFVYLSCLLAACSAPTPDYQALLQGSWQFGNKFHQAFYFEDSLSSYSYPFNGFSKYHLQGDTLVISSSEKNKYQFKHPFLFKIIQVDSLSLVLQNLSIDNGFTVEVEDSNGIFILQKIRPKNKATPLFISYCSAGCHGSCPILSIEIDSNLNVLFYGQNYLPLKGTYSGTLPPKQYEYLLDYTRNLPLEEIKEQYEIPVTHQHSQCLYIQYEDQALQTCSYGYSTEPIELTILYHKLLEIYKLATLEPDSSLKRESFQHQFWTCGIPPPPPPPPVE